MDRGRKVVLGTAIAIGAAIIAGVIASRTSTKQSASLTGAVLQQAGDPRREIPIAGAEITALSNSASAATRSDVSGFFRLILPPEVKIGQAVTLTFRHSGYQPLHLTEPATDRIYIARLVPVHTESSAEAHGVEVVISNLQVRYSVKNTATVNVGSIAKTFEVSNVDGLPCNGHAPCSPDGRWKAAIGSMSYDAGEGNQFRNVRVSCIAGPCPFTHIEPTDFSNQDRIMKVSSSDWSDTTTFLVEAEVSRTLVSDAVRYSIPVIFGNGMNFTLPQTAEGPSIEAELNGSDIVFPLGPDNLLSWAVCTLKPNANGSKLYGCEVKPGYRFQ